MLRYASVRGAREFGIVTGDDEDANLGIGMFLLCFSGGFRVCFFEGLFSDGVGKKHRADERARLVKKR